MKDALIQASLDPIVRTIEFVPCAHVGEQTVKLDTVVLARGDGRYALDIPEARALRDLDSEGLFLLGLEQLNIGYLELSADEIRREPRYSNCREVWTHRSVIVSANARARIIAALEEGEPLSISELSGRITAGISPTSAIFSLACEGAIEIDLSETLLSGRTTVRRMASGPCSTSILAFGRA